jgi:carboxylesterase
MGYRRDLPEVIPSWDETWLLKDRTQVEVAYREMARTTLPDLLGLAKVVEEMLPVLVVPTLILQSGEDRVVPPDNGPYMLERIGSSDKRLVTLPNSYHVGTMDYDRGLVAEEVIGFVRRLTAANAESAAHHAGGADE